MRCVKSRSKEDTWRVFNKMPTCSVVSWICMIMRHLKCGHGQKAMELYLQMQQEGVQFKTHPVRLPIW
jgi:pentatricopeptide repeat protein